KRDYISRKLFRVAPVAQDPQPALSQRLPTNQNKFRRSKKAPTPKLPCSQTQNPHKPRRTRSTPKRSDACARVDQKDLRPTTNSAPSSRDALPTTTVSARSKLPSLSRAELKNCPTSLRV